MSLRNCTTPELYDLLMEETMRLTSTWRDKISVEEKRKIRLQVNEIIAIIEERTGRNSSPTYNIYKEAGRWLDKP